MSAFWVGLDGLSSETVEQDGTLAFCYLGRAFYYSWWEMYPSNAVQIVGSVSPGDKITASVDYSKATTMYTLKLADAAQPASSFTLIQACGGQGFLACDNSSAEWVAETPSDIRGLWPWPNFGTWNLTKATVKSGATSGGISTGPWASFGEDLPVTIIGNDSENLATTGPLNSSGNGFSVTWAYTY